MEIMNEKEIPEVSVDIMNKTHQEEVALINEIGELINTTQLGIIDNQEVDPVAQRVITTKLKKWLEHTREHFDRENRFMQEYGFPAYDIHSQAHHDALWRQEQVVENWEKTKDLEEVSEYLFETWPAWFQQHVKTMDFMTAQFLSMRMK